MMPLIPHLTSECLEDVQDNNKKKWPKVDEQFLTSNNVNLVIQINGKKRSIINILKGTDEDKLIKQVKNDSKSIRKMIILDRLNSILHKLTNDQYDKNLHLKLKSYIYIIMN